MHRLEETERKIPRAVPECKLRRCHPYLLYFTYLTDIAPPPSINDTLNSRSGTLHSYIDLRLILLPFFASEAACIADRVLTFSLSLLCHWLLVCDIATDSPFSNRSLWLASYVGRTAGGIRILPTCSFEVCQLLTMFLLYVLVVPCKHRGVYEWPDSAPYA